MIMTKAKKIIIATCIIVFTGLCFLGYLAISWMSRPAIRVIETSELESYGVTMMNEESCKIAGALCWRPARGYFDYDTAFYVFKKAKECNLDYHVEEKNDKNIFVTISEVNCNLKSSDAKDAEVFNILNIIDQRELSKLHFTYKFHDGSPDSHTIINLVK